LRIYIHKEQPEALMRQALDKETLKTVYGRLAKRYDWQHAWLTARADQRGRRMLVEHAVQEGDHVLDCGAGTGSTALLAARKTGASGHVTLFDLSEDMLAVAREKMHQAGLQDRVSFKSGDMEDLPFVDNHFDVILSTYSLCPLGNPERGVREMYRVARAGGRIGVAHSTEPRGKVVRWLAERVEDMAWHFPWLSMGCRSVDVLPALEQVGGRLLMQQYIGVPLWPFLVFVVEKA